MKGYSAYVEYSSTWRWAARSFFVRAAADQRAAVLVPSLVIELTQEPIEHGNTDDLAYVAKALAAMVGDGALGWFDQMIPSRRGQMIAIAALVTLDTPASTERLMAFARDSSAQVRDLVTPELLRRGATPAAAPTTDLNGMIALYTQPPFPAVEISEDFQGWWTLAFDTREAFGEAEGALIGLPT